MERSRTLLAEMGFTGTLRSLPLEDRRRYYAEAARRRPKDKEKVRAMNREYYQKNREREIARATAYAKNNRDKVRACARRAQMVRYHSDPGFKMMVRCRTRLYELLRKQNQHRSATIKLNKVELVRHLESQFLPGMTWENHGTVWHVDHVRPCASFDFSDPKQIEECFSLSNLRPLWARENIQKSDKILP